MTKLIAIFADFVYQSNVISFSSRHSYCIDDDFLSIFAVYLSIFVVYLFNFLFDQQRRSLSLKLAQQDRSKKNLHLSKFCFEF